MKRRIALTSLLWRLLVVSQGQVRAAEAPLVFVVSARAQITDVSSAQLRRIYLGRTTRWSTGRRIALAVRPASSAVGHAFFERVVRMSDIDFSQLWLGIVFRGEAATAPRVVDSVEAVIRFLSRNPDGLVVALSSEIDPRSQTERPLTIDGKGPTDPGYPFIGGS
jgi:hypothetical protein